MAHRHQRSRRPQLRRLLLVGACGLLGPIAVPRQALGQRATTTQLPPACPAPDTSGLLARFLDIGQGDAALLETGDGKRVLVDGGPSAGRLRPLLQARRVRALDLVVASHHHLDHIGGLPALFRQLPVANMLENGMPATTRIYRDLLTALEAGGTRLLRADERILTLGTMQLRVLPPLAGADDQNLASVGLIASHGAFRILFTGDAEVAALDAWVRAGRIPEVTVVKAAHHGSENGTTAQLVAATKPRLVVISAGRGNSYGHPHAITLMRWQAPGRQILRTDRDGTITIRGCRDGSTRVVAERTGTR